MDCGLRRDSNLQPSCVQHRVATQHHHHQVRILTLNKAELSHEAIGCAQTLAEKQPRLLGDHISTSTSGGSSVSQVRCCLQFTSLRARLGQSEPRAAHPPHGSPPPRHGSNWLMRKSISPNPLLSLNKYLLEICPPTDIHVMLGVVSLTDHTQGLHLSLGELGGGRGRG